MRPRLLVDSLVTSECKAQKPLLVAFQDRRIQPLILSAAGCRANISHIFGVAPLWHGLCRIKRSCWVADGIVAERKASRDNTFRYLALFVGIVAIRFRFPLALVCHERQPRMR
jgi:hypothetical protein